MVLYVQYGHSVPEQYVLVRPDDFEPLMLRYPGIVSKVMMCNTVDDAARRVANYLNTGHMMAWIDGEGMSKAQIFDFQSKQKVADLPSNQMAKPIHHKWHTLVGSQITFDNTKPTPSFLSGGTPRSQWVGQVTHSTPEGMSNHYDLVREPSVSDKYLLLHHESGKVHYLGDPEVHHIADYAEAAAEGRPEQIAGYGETSPFVQKAMPKNLMATAALGAALLGPATHLPTKQLDAIHPQQTMTAEPFGQRNEDSFLWNIKQLESTGGKNLSHRQVKHGMHAGETAVGRYGLMPKTIIDVVNRIRGKGKSEPALDMVVNMPRQHVGEYLKQNPAVELNVARFLARHVLHRHRGDEQRAAFSWLHGHNLHSTDILPEDLQRDKYVQKYNEHQKRNPFKMIQSPALMHKAELSQKEDKQDLSLFKDKLKHWTKYRAEKDNIPLHDNTWVQDPGRQRVDDNYEQPSGANLIRRYVASRTK